MQNLEDSEHAKTTYQQKPLKLDQCNSGIMTSYRGMTSSLFYSNDNRQHVMFSRCQCARSQVYPKESNRIAINKIIKYLKGLPTPGVKYPKDIMLNMFGYIDTDYAGCKKDRPSISEAVNLSDRRSIPGSSQLHGRRLISCYDEKQLQIQQLCGTLYDKAPSHQVSLL